MVRDCIGREWQLGTVQLDYNLPSAERFALEYIGADNQPHRPVMIHRAPLGSLERFIGVLIEHFAGAFPLWLAPEQVRVLTVSEKSESYGREIEQKLRPAGLPRHRRLPRRKARRQSPRRTARADPVHVRRRPARRRAGHRLRSRPHRRRPGLDAAGRRDRQAYTKKSATKRVRQVAKSKAPLTESVASHEY